MNSHEIYHTGVLGMKWGVRRSSSSSGSSSSKKVSNTKTVKTKTPVKPKSVDDTKDSKQNAPKAQNKKSVKDMTDEELKAKINRLDLEKRYSELESQMNQKKASKGKAFVSSVIEQSAKNIATQATTYVIGKAVNKALANAFNDPSVVNPKKGQKDK